MTYISLLWQYDLRPLHPDISIYILHPVLHTFPADPERRINLTKASFNGDHFLNSHDLPFLIHKWNCKKKLEASHSKVQQVNESTQNSQWIVKLCTTTTVLWAGFFWLQSQQPNCVSRFPMKLSHSRYNLYKWTTYMYNGLTGYKVFPLLVLV